MKLKDKLNAGDTVILHSGFKGVVEKIENDVAWIRHENGDFFRYTLYGECYASGGECASVNIYDFYDGSMDVWRVDLSDGYYPIEWI